MGFTHFSLFRLAGGRSTRHLERHVDVEWPVLKVQRTLASQDGECQVPAAAAIGLQNLSGCSQSWDRLPECRLAAVAAVRVFNVHALGVPDCDHSYSCIVVRRRDRFQARS